MITLIYCLIILIVCSVGAIIGIGGGIIIKPVLDLIGYHSVETVGFISSCAVFSMSISSSVSHIVSKTKFDKKIVIYISLGSVLGGIAGNAILSQAFARLNENTVKGIQGIMIAAIIIFVVIYVNLKNAVSFKLKSPVIIVVTAFILGMISTFLNIGGGLLNIACLTLLFSFTVKESAVYSVAVIFFSQLSRLVMVFISNQFEPFREYFPIIAAVICTAIISGIIGSKLNKKLSASAVNAVFSVVLSSVALINIFNAVTGFTF